MDNLKATLDTLTRANDQQRERLRRVGAASTSRAAAGPFRFQVNDPVIDLATGRGGTVVNAARGEFTDLELYRVELVTGETIFRHHNEIARNEATAAPIGIGGQ